MIDRRGRRRRMRPRARTVAAKHISREALIRGWLEIGGVPDDELFAGRPKTRGECVDAPRPCPWVGCRYSLYLEVSPTGSIKLVFPDLEPWELQHTCALDVADSGGLTLEDVGAITNLTRERIRQVEVRGLLKMRQAAIARDIEPEDAAFPHPEGFLDEPPRTSTREESAKRARAAYNERKRVAKEAA